MATFVALLRAINVGGTGILPMKELAAMCVELSFKNVRTYIQSGNVLFESAAAEKTLQARLEKVLTERLGKKADVVLRTAAELQAVIEMNPFPDAPPAQVIVVFLASAVGPDFLNGMVAPDGEDARVGKREIYIHYPKGMGRSKLKIPALRTAGTARNMNTVAKLVAMTAA